MVGFSFGFFFKPKPKRVPSQERHALQGEHWVGAGQGWDQKSVSQVGRGSAHAKPAEVPPGPRMGVLLGLGSSLLHK